MGRLLFPSNCLAHEDEGIRLNILPENLKEPWVSFRLEIGNKFSQILAGYEICCMFVFPGLGLFREVKRVFDFLKIYRFDPGSSRYSQAR